MVLDVYFQLNAQHMISTIVLLCWQHLNK